MGTVTNSAAMKWIPHLHIKPCFKNYVKWDDSSWTEEFLTGNEWRHLMKLALGKIREWKMKTWCFGLSVLIPEEMRCISMIVLLPLHGTEADQWAWEQGEISQLQVISREVNEQLRPVHLIATCACDLGCSQMGSSSTLLTSSSLTRPTWRQNTPKQSFIKRWFHFLLLQKWKSCPNLPFS